MEVAPPGGLLLTPVPADELREEPACLLLPRALQRIGGYTSGQLLHERLQLREVPLDVIVRRPLRERPPRHRSADELGEFRAPVLQPVPQLPGGEAVVAVVAGDARQDRAVVGA